MSTPIDLTPSALPAVSGAAVPSYDRAVVRLGIVHFGVGGFHRAHQAAYVDRLLESGPDAAGWGICGVGLRPADAAMRDALVPQSGLYTLTLKHPDGVVETSVIGAIVDYLYAPDDPEAVIERLAAPETRIVSLTITEGGYNFSATTGDFDAENPDVRHDLEPGAAPRTVFGYVTEALRRRRDRGLAAFTVMSCDNIEGNGHVARRTVTAFARLADPELAEWISEHVRFPNSMVDRITPATPDGLRAEVAARAGVDDRWPVVAEPFTQWVLEDAFGAGRPRFEDAGVQVVDDVAPYELMKLRLLNAGHQALGHFARLLGYEYVHDAAADPDVRELLRRYMQEEGRPTLRAVPGIDLDDYIDTLLERFSNPAIADTVARLCQDASDRIPKWLVPVIVARLDDGAAAPLAAAVVAAWTRGCEGFDDAGAPITLNDREAEALARRALGSRTELLAFVAVPDLFGDLAERPGFSEPYLATLAALREKGARVVLRDLLAR
ncbi:mannitol dehydrogenase family protein [Tsukamurella paurometabola]|uniref:Mannitol-1-phosphate 5-dehydrogenase n=1 Tax=Tsukamurella paurometabola TaxID=2061 RepID=A0A3P8KU48_TSUPA|nr:mannitol dehydrogenase family protein [Tsukamurella paurometabola]MBS4100940.1 mannitol dehydrogenase family protein [Tsukamurella paurometabola]UEA83360.1 mannitol dehydrogenase family protein [Tsukamurella paurometabola]VDR40467.1 Polyol:NADP oxidoreductase [Tsukamurella paurometabola]